MYFQLDCVFCLFLFLNCIEFYFYRSQTHLNSWATASRCPVGGAVHYSGVFDFLKILFHIRPERSGRDRCCLRVMDEPLLKGYQGNNGQPSEPWKEKPGQLLPNPSPFQHNHSNHLPHLQNHLHNCQIEKCQHVDSFGKLIIGLICCILKEICCCRGWRTTHGWRLDSWR